MSSSELPPDPFGESSPNDALGVRDLCFSEVEEVLARGYSDLFADDGKYLGVIITDKMEDAVSTMHAAVVAGDDAQAATHGSQVDAYLSSLQTIPGVREETFTKACFLGMDTEDGENAFTTLSIALEAERERVRRHAASLIKSPAYFASSLHAGLLEGVIDMCVANNTQLDDWIEYALDHEQRWILSMKYYEKLADAGVPEDVLQSQIEAKVGELLEMEQSDIEPYGPGRKLIYDEATRVLMMVKEPGLRQHYLERFMRIASIAPIDIHTFSRLIRVSEVILESLPAQSDLTDRQSDMVAFLKEEVEGRFQALWNREGTDLFDLEFRHMSWGMNIKKHGGATPEMLLDALDLRTLALLQRNIPDESRPTFHPSISERSRKNVMAGRNEILRSFAVRYATQHNFEAAGQFLYNISDRLQQLDTLWQCLQEITTPEQLEQISPNDEMAFETTTNFGVALRFTRAKLEGDAVTISDIARECAQTIDDEGETWAFKRLCIKSAYDILEGQETQDEQSAVALVKELLTTLRANRESYSNSSYLSNALIRAGDPDEPLQAYLHINQTDNESARLLDVWRLARLIDAHMGTAA